MDTVLEVYGFTRTNANALLDRKMNKSSSTVEDPAYLKLPLTNPKLKKITLHFPLGLEVNARNLKGVTIKDALDAIYKQFKKRVRLIWLSFAPCIGDIITFSSSEG